MKAKKEDKQEARNSGLTKDEVGQVIRNSAHHEKHAMKKAD